MSRHLDMEYRILLASSGLAIIEKNKIAVHITIPAYTNQNTACTLLKNHPWLSNALPKSSPVGTMSIIMGQKTTKNNSSKNKVVKVSVVALPNDMPSLLR